MQVILPNESFVVLRVIGGGHFFNTANFPLKCEKIIDIFMASLKLLEPGRLISYAIPLLTIHLQFPVGIN